MQTEALLLFWGKSLTVLTMLWACFSSLSCFSIHRVSFVSGPSPRLRQLGQHRTFPSTNRPGQDEETSSPKKLLGLNCKLTEIYSMDRAIKHASRSKKYNSIAIETHTHESMFHTVQYSSTGLCYIITSTSTYSNRCLDLQYILSRQVLDVPNSTS